MACSLSEAAGDASRLLFDVNRSEPSNQRVEEEQQRDAREETHTLNHSALHAED